MCAGRQRREVAMSPAHTGTPRYGLGISYPGVLWYFLGGFLFSVSISWFISHAAFVPKTSQNKFINLRLTIVLISSIIKNPVESHVIAEEVSNPTIVGRTTVIHLLVRL